MKIWTTTATTSSAPKSLLEYAGDQVVDLVEILIERGEYDPDMDVLVVTADHCECLATEPYGMLGHFLPAFWEDIMNVALVVGRPELTSDSDDRQVSLVDLLPILLVPVNCGSMVDRRITGPSDLHREVVRSVSHWKHHGSGKIRTYRGDRREDEAKCFWAFRRDEDQFPCAGLNEDTEEIRGVWPWEDFTLDDLRSYWVELYRMLTADDGAVKQMNRRRHERQR